MFKAEYGFIEILTLDHAAAKDLCTDFLAMIFTGYSCGWWGYIPGESLPVRELRSANNCLWEKTLVSCLHVLQRMGQALLYTCILSSPGQGWKEKASLPDLRVKLCQNQDASSLAQYCLGPGLRGDHIS